MKMFALTDMEQIANGVEEDFMNFCSEKQHGVCLQNHIASLEVIMQRPNLKIVPDILSNLHSFVFYASLLFGCQGEVATRRPMHPAGGQMCGRMTC